MGFRVFGVRDWAADDVEMSRFGLRENPKP